MLKFDEEICLCGWLELTLLLQFNDTQVDLSVLLFQDKDILNSFL